MQQLGFDLNTTLVAAQYGALKLVHRLDEPHDIAAIRAGWEYAHLTMPLPPKPDYPF